MKLYADQVAHRGRQVIGDLALLTWVLVWIWLGHEVHAATLGLAKPGYKTEAAGTDMADKLRDAGSTVGGIPYVGDDAAKPFDGAGSSAQKLAAAGRAQVEAVHTLANWLGVVVAVIPIVVVALLYLPPRIRFVQRATAGQRFLDSAADLDLFALRALANQPLHVLARVSPDPATAWREQNSDIVRRLAVLELTDAGLSLPPGPSPGGTRTQPIN